MTWHGKHHYTFKNLKNEDKELIGFNGLRAFILCDNMVHLIPDLLKTVALFLGGFGIVPSANIPFIGLQSAFVATIWKRAGVPSDKEINTPEFTPRDAYQLKIFDTETPLPGVCKWNDPSLPFFQLFDKHLMKMQSSDRTLLLI